jgi:hypothetical protein
MNGIETIYKCKQLISSVSLNVLKNTANLFTPPLPATKLNSLNRLKQGTNNKIFYVFDRNVFAPGSKNDGRFVLVAKQFAINTKCGRKL